MTVELTNGTVLNLGNIKGENGIGIAKSEINANGELVLTYTDGNTANLGKVAGANGKDGADGKDGQDGVNGIDGINGQNGKDGRGIAKTEIIDGHLWITYTDDLTNPVDLGNVSSNNAEISDENFVYVLLDDGTFGIKAASTFSLTEVIIPSSYNGIAVTQILENGFENKTGITSVAFPESLTKIGRYAFAGCTGLTEITIPENTKFIGAYAFYGAGLTSATLNGNWLCGNEDFQYNYFYRWHNSGSTDLYENTNVEIKTYDISNSSNAAQVLIQPIEVVYKREVYKNGYTGKTTTTDSTTHYYWFAEDWTCIS